MSKFTAAELASVTFPINAFEVCLTTRQSTQTSHLKASHLKCAILPITLIGIGHRGVIHFLDSAGEKCYGDPRSFFRTEADATQHIAKAYNLKPEPKSPHVPVPMPLDEEMSVESEEDELAIQNDSPR